MSENAPGRITAQALADCGADVVFTLVGGHTTPIVDACPEAGVRLILSVSKMLEPVLMFQDRFFYRSLSW